MVNIDNIIELKRGMFLVCDLDIIDEITNQAERCEEFYKNIFLLYGVQYDTATIKQKREFVAATTKYFVIDRLPKDSVTTNQGQYTRKYKLEEYITEIINRYFELRKNFPTLEMFAIEYKNYYKTFPKSFKKEIEANRDDFLSDFAKAVEKVYYCEDKDIP